MSSGWDLTWSLSEYAGTLGRVPTHHVLVSPEPFTPLPILTMGNRLGKPQSRTPSVFKQPKRPQGN